MGAADNALAIDHDRGRRPEGERKRRRRWRRISIPVAGVAYRTSCPFAGVRCRRADEAKRGDQCRRRQSHSVHLLPPDEPLPMREGRPTASFARNRQWVNVRRRALALHARKEWPAIVVNQGRIGVQIMAPLPAMGQKWRWLARSTRCGRAPTRDASLDTMLLSIAGAGSGCLRPPRLSMFHRPGWPTRPLAGTRRRRSRSYTRRARPSRRRNRRQRDWRIRRTPAV